jgi:hypothetical protein
VATERQTSLLLKYHDPNGSTDGLDIRGIWRSKFNSFSLLALGDFFQPETLVIMDKVFLKSPGYSGQSHDEFLAIRQKYLMENPKSQLILDSFNWIEIYYELGNFDSSGVLSDEEDDEMQKNVAELLRNSWFSWLHNVYPERSFSVRIVTPQETGSVWGVGFSEIC